jgi:hypothetical protein
VHPSESKLHALLRRAYPDELSADALKILQEICHACHACQTFAMKPITFQVCFPDDVVFNQQVLFDIFWIDKRPALSVVDSGTNFCAARFLAAENVSTVWNTFLEAWSLMYVGIPGSMLTDQGCVFLCTEWKQACEHGKVSLRHTGTESHNSLGAGEQIHSRIRTIYNKISVDHPNLQPSIRLSITVKELNDTAGPDCLVPSLLVFRGSAQTAGNHQRLSGTASAF